MNSTPVTLSIVLPVFNEAQSLRHVVESWHTALNLRSIKHEFLICEDGSTDGTKELVLEMASSLPIVNLSSIERRAMAVA